MENTELGRQVLAVIEAEPIRLAMGTWGNGSHRPDQEWKCGTSACLAGHAMICSGYVMRNGEFYRPDGTYVLNEAAEARKLLGMGYEECGVFYKFIDPVGRFRRMVEESEKAKADAGKLLP